MSFLDWTKTNDVSLDDGSLKEIWEATGDYQGSYQPDVASGLATFQERLSAENGGKIVSLRSKWVKAMQIAASAAILVVAGYAVFNFAVSEKITQKELATLSNENKELLLNDGSEVSLNKNSTLYYPEVFSQNKRALNLNGEAFFEVAKDETKPFQVNTENIEIEVLGTSFNVRDYSRENLSTVFVKTGKVAVTVPATNERYTLTPGQVLVFDKETGKVEVEIDGSDNPIAWKTRVLRFRNSPLEEIFSNMEQLYDVRFSVASAALAKCPFTTTVRSANLREALDAIEASCDLNFEITSPGSFKVSGKCCE